MQERRWAIVQLMGHMAIAGEVEHVEAGNRLRVKVPAVDEFPAYEVEYGPGAVFEVRWCSEEAARQAAAYLKRASLPFYARDDYALPGPNPDLPF